MRLQSHCWPKLQSSEGLTTAEASTSKEILLTCRHVEAGCWQEASVFSTWPSTEHCCVFSLDVASSSQASDPKESQAEAILFVTYSQNSTYYYTSPPVVSH